LSAKKFGYNKGGRAYAFAALIFYKYLDLVKLIGLSGAGS